MSHEKMSICTNEESVVATKIYTARIKSWEELKSENNGSFFNPDNFDEEEIHLKSDYYISSEVKEITGKEVEIIDKHRADGIVFTKSEGGVYIYPGMIDETTIRNIGIGSEVEFSFVDTKMTDEIAHKLLMSEDEGDRAFGQKYLDSKNGIPGVLQDEVDIEKEVPLKR